MTTLKWHCVNYTTQSGATYVARRYEYLVVSKNYTRVFCTDYTADKLRHCEDAPDWGLDTQDEVCDTLSA